MKSLQTSIFCLFLALSSWSPIAVSAVVGTGDRTFTGGDQAACRMVGADADGALYRQDGPLDLGCEDAIAWWRAQGGPDTIEADMTYRASLLPNDTFYKEQWYLERIRAKEAWDTVRESPEVVIAIVDSGVDIRHPDLKDNLWRNTKEIEGNGFDDDKNGYIDDIFGWDFVNEISDPRPKFKEGFTEAGMIHGTVVAGVAGASGNNAAGVAGVTWRTKIMSLKVLNDSGEGDTYQVSRAIDYATRNGANIINLSFVGSGRSELLGQAIKRAYDAGVMVVAAAGNEQGEGHGLSLDDEPMYPACQDGPNGENWVIGVAATDALDQRAAFSHYGRRCVDISAPGVSIYSTTLYAPNDQIDGKFFNKFYEGYWSGTSLATPMVSGALALLTAANPSFGRERVVSTLLDNADNIDRLNPGYVSLLGRGRLNIAAAVTAARHDLERQSSYLAWTPGAGRAPEIVVSDQEGRNRKSWLAFDQRFMGGVKLSAGDLYGDRTHELIAAAGAGGGPHVRIFDQNGKLKGQFFAYGSTFRGGVNVAAGDVNGDGRDEIITGPGPGGGPHVRIFDQNGKLKGQFFAYGSTFRGGVNVAAGDVNGDGRDEIITGPGPGGGPQIRIFDGAGKVIGQFFAYGSTFRGGVNVAAGDVDGGARGRMDEIITGPGAGGGPEVRIFDRNGLGKGRFLAYQEHFSGGVRVALFDHDSDGLADIVTGAGAGGAPHLRIFDRSGGLLDSFYAFDERFSGGLYVAAWSQEISN